MKKFAATFVFLSTLVQAQYAKVVALTPEETRQAETLHKKQAEIASELLALNDRIEAKYNVGAKGQCVILRTNGICIDYEWQYGFLFSEDFRFIVPAPGPIHSTLNWGSPTDSHMVLW